MKLNFTLKKFLLRTYFVLFLSILSGLIPALAQQTEDFNGFTIGDNVGDHTNWFDNNNGPVVQATNGVNGSQGLEPASAIFIWTAQGFNWNAVDFVGVNIQMDFKTDGSGHFDDDRIGWMITDDEVSSSNIFSVQLDPGGSGYNIEGYWDGVSSNDRRPSIVDLPTLSADTWYRFRLEVGKLTATSASLDVSLTELDGSGNPTGTPVTGSIPNTADLGDDEPHSKYFTADAIWAAYKNYTAAGAPADNAFMEVITGGSTPAIIISGTPLDPFSSEPGVPSAEQDYTVEGTDLTTDITITAPTDFEISTTSGSGFSTSLTLTQTSGTVAATPIYVRMNRATEGAPAGNITHTSSGATTQNVAVEGTVTTTEPSINFEVRVSQDSDDAEEEVSTGAMDLTSTDLELIRDGSTDQLVGLRFQNVLVPPGATIQSAYIEFEADQPLDLNPCNLTIYGQAALNPETFTEDPGNISGRTQTSASASWSPGTWSIDEKYQTSDISAVVQEIIDQSGWASENAMVFIIEGEGGREAESNDGESAAAPLLVIDYKPSTDPIISITDIPLNSFSSQPGIPSEEQNYTVSGTNLTENIVITAPTDFEISTTSGSVFGTSLVLTQTAGVVASTPIYVRMNRATEGTPAGNITHTSSGATTQNVTLAGTVAEPIEDWVAFNDMNGITGDDNESYVTRHDYDSSDASLTDSITGTAITATISGSYNNYDPKDGNGGPSDAGTDAGNIFGVAGSEIVDLMRTIELDESDWYNTITLNNLNPSKVYDITLTANRNDAAYTDRWTKVTIEGADDFTNNSSSGVSVADPGNFSTQNAVSFCTGYNTENGYVARWTNISPGTDGSFSVKSEMETGFDGGEKGYAMSAFRLAEKEETTTTPIISISGTPLDPFSSEPGIPSAEQDYTVEGTDLTTDITITAPTDFEISTTSGSGFGSSLTLAQSGGSVPATPIYVRMNRATEGTPVGNITHTSSGVTTQNVAVTGESTTTEPGTMICEDFDTFTTGETVGSDSDWFDNGNGPVVNANGGVANSQGLDPASAIFTWTNNPFNWNDPDFQAINLRMDFQTDENAEFDDDRVGWMTEDESINSDLIFGIQLDNKDGHLRIEGYWDNIPGDNAGRVEMADLDGASLSANAWYQLVGTITKLGATSAQLDAELWSLDASGLPVSLIASGSIPNTDLVGAGLTPHSGYFTGTNQWPGFKNYSNSSGSADNACFEVIGGGTTNPVVNITGTPLNQFSTTPGIPSSEQSYTVSGSNLTDDIVISSPADFEISFTSGSGFVSSLVLTQSSGSVSVTPIYVRFVRAIEGISSGNITHTSSGAVTKNVAVSGNTELPTEAGKVIISGIQAWNTPDGQSPGEFIELFNTSDAPISLENLEIISRTDNNSDGIVDTDWQLSDESPSLSGKSIAPHSFFLIAEAGVAAPSGLHDLEVGMNLATGEGGFEERAISIQLIIDGTHMDYVLYGRHDGSSPSGEIPPGDVSFDGSYPRFEVVRNTQSSGSYQEGLIRRESAEDLYAGYDVLGFFTDEDALGDGYPSGVWSSPHSQTYGAYEARNSLSPAVPEDPGTGTDLWVAFNDMNGETGDNNETYVTLHDYNVSNAALIDSITGTLISTANVSLSGSNNYDDSFIQNGGPVNAGTDAGNIFGFSGSEIVDLQGTLELDEISHYNTMIFNNLDPTKYYDITLTSNRDNIDYAGARFTKVTIEGADSYTNSSSTGVVVYSESSVSFSVGYNTVNGYVARWTNVSPGADGSFSVKSEWDDTQGSGAENSKGYAMTAFRLAEIGETTNNPPNVLTLIQPADDEINVSNSPILEVNVSDPDEDPLQVTFYGRAVNTSAATGDDFTIIGIPDTQKEAESYPAAFTSQTQWIADNKTNENIVFVTHLGDIVDESNQEFQWINADNAMDLLDAADVAYSVSPGNHDLGSGSYYETYFGVDRFSGKSYYAGNYGSNNENNYSLFSASGLDFILINCRYSADASILNWADGLLKAHPDRRGIFVQHDILNYDDSWNNQNPYTALKDNPNLFLMLCGHRHTSSDGAAYRAELGDDGHTIHIMMADYQDFPNGGDGYLRLLRFSPVNNNIFATTYSPFVPGSITTYPDEMEMVYDMGGSGEFELLGTVNVASGENASVTWPGREDNTEYKWYAVVTDGSSSRTSATWSFNTGIEEPSLIASPDDISLDYMAGSNQTFEITSNTTWSITDNADWLEVSPLAGSNDGIITVNAISENTGPDLRTATVTITGDGVDDKAVVVTQQVETIGDTDIGYKDVFGSTSNNMNRRASPVTFTEDGDITSISIYHNGGSGDVLLAVYSDQPGLPSSRLGVTASTAINASEGWQTVPLESTVAVTAGQTVWLAWVFETNPGIRYTSGTPGRAQSSDTWSGGMPSTFGSSYVADYRYSIFCTYTPDLSKSTVLFTTEVVPMEVETNELKVYPNPFSKELNFEFTSAKNAHALLEIYNLSGQAVVRLFDQPVLKGEKNRVEFIPNRLISGIYFYRLELDNEIKMGKVVYKKY